MVAHLVHGLVDCTLAFQSAVDIAFWSELSDLKLNVWRLSEERINLQGTLVGCTNARATLSLIIPMLCRELQLNPWARHARLHAA